MTYGVIWNGAKNAFSDGEEAEDEAKSEVADIRAWQKSERYQDMAKCAKRILARNSRRDLHPANSIAKEELLDYMKEQIEHESFLAEYLETLISQSGMFQMRMRNNANKNCRVSFREEFPPKEKVIGSTEREIKKERKGEQSEPYV
jgi:hypothetical protein